MAWISQINVLRLYYIIITQKTNDMTKYMLIARLNKRYDIVTVRSSKEYVERIKRACEKLDKVKTYEIIVMGNEN